MTDWQPMKTAPKDGSLILLLCEYDDAREPALAYWVDNAWPATGPFGAFSWRELDGAGIAEKVPSRWAPVPKFARKRVKSKEVRNG